MDPELLDQLRRAAEAVFSLRPVALAYLYGSQASGQATPLSDVDVAIVTDRELSPRDRLRLELTLETDLAAVLRHEVDVRVINHAPLLVRGTVVQTGIPLYVRDDAARVNFETAVAPPISISCRFCAYHRAAYFASQRALLRERGIL